MRYCRGADLLDSSIAAQRAHYDAHFSHIEHDVVCDAPPSSTVRLHFVRPDASGEPRFRELARLLARYITVYCVRAERLKNLSPVEFTEMVMQARDLFRKTGNSGQVGELLVYFLLETVLGAPQAIKKMPMTTNPNEERKSSDGVHLRWDHGSGVLEFIFAESKIWKSFSAALVDAFKSMEAFHDSRTKQFEVNAFTSSYSNLDSDLQKKVLSYIEGPDVSNARWAQACLIGFNWDEYQCLKDSRRSEFIREFETRYRAWGAKIRESLNGKLRDFKHKHLHFEFFMLPFADVEAFRAWFYEDLTGTKFADNELTSTKSTE